LQISWGFNTKSEMDTVFETGKEKEIATVKKKRPLFKDRALQLEFERTGYVVIAFLTDQEITALSEAYLSLQGDLGEPAFASTIMSGDPEYRLAVSAMIEKTFARAANQIFDDACIFWGNFNIKYPRRNMGAVPLHQDPSFLDERRYDALAIWVPLTDTTPENGALQVVPGSHTVIRPPRCNGRPFAYGAQQELLLEKFGRQLLMIAGQAYIGSPALFHASPANTSCSARIAAAALVGPAESALRYFRHTQNDGKVEVEMIKADREYYLTAPLFSLPTAGRYPLLEIIPADDPIPTADQLFNILSNLNQS
jgi:hypothetical protein